MSKVWKRLKNEQCKIQNFSFHKNTVIRANLSVSAKMILVKFLPQTNLTERFFLK
jgi:hypothetical protein